MSEKATSPQVKDREKDRDELVRELDEKCRELEELRSLFGIVENGKKEWEIIMDCVGDMIVFSDEDGKVKRINKSFQQLIDKPYKEILGNDRDVVIHEENFKLISQIGDVQDMQHIRTGKRFDLHTYHIDSDKAGFSGSVAVLHETTMIRAMHEQLKENELRFRSVTETAQDAIISIDQSGDIIYCNKAAERIFGYTVVELLGEPVTMLMSKKYREAHKSGLSRVIAGGETKLINNSVEITAITKDQTELPIEISMAKWTTEGKIYFTAMIRDISARKAAEEELKQSHSTILQQEKMASIGQLAAGVAHEINNPMGFISSNLGTLGKYAGKMTEFIKVQSDEIEALKSAETEARLKEKRKKLKLDYIVEDIQQLIEESLDGAERVKRIVQNLKTFSRVDEAEHQMADINECIESTLNIVWNELKYKVTMEKDYGEIPRTKCFPQQLNQVFMNILVNGAHAIEKQGEIRIKTWNGDKNINISISDTGGGIPEEKLGKIFDPFFTTKEVGKGTGLGLSIAYDIVKKHNGTIAVESETGKGTTFTIRIPVVEREES